MSCGSFNIDELASALHGVEDVGIILTTEDKLAAIRVTIHDPFDEVLYVLCGLINVVENQYCIDERLLFISRSDQIDR